MMEFSLDSLVIGGQIHNLTELVSKGVTRPMRDAAVRDCLSQRFPIDKFYEACLKLAPVPISNDEEAAKAALESTRNKCLEILNQYRPVQSKRVGIAPNAVIYKPEPPYHRDITKLTLIDGHGSTQLWTESHKVGGIPFAFTVELFVDGITFQRTTPPSDVRAV